MSQTSGLSKKDPGTSYPYVSGALFLLATFQLVLYYLLHVPSWISRTHYENGTSRMPFQGRLMMMLILRWSHHSRILIAAAAFAGRAVPWIRPHGGPEFIVQFLIDSCSILVAGFVATSLYQASSDEHLLTPFIYPTVLVLCVVTYVLQVTQFVRFYYDFPGLAFFSAGIYLIYFRRNRIIFFALFLVATINRETTLFLLLFYVLAHVRTDHGTEWRRLMQPRVWGVVGPLAALWSAWHLWVAWMFRHNPSGAGWRCDLNAASLVWPPIWPQLFGLGCYLLPLIFVFRRSIKDPILRAWMWTIPAWLAVMFFYGMWIEPRIMGELIPYLACLAALIAEESIVARFKSPPQTDAEVPLPAIG